MTRKRDRSEPRQRISPTQTVSHLTDDFVEELALPVLPESLPQRLAEAIGHRVEALLYHLREAKRRQYVGALEIRLVREAHQAVLTACELHLPDGSAYYAEFRQLMLDLGYEKVAVGFAKPDSQRSG